MTKFAPQRQDIKMKILSLFTFITIALLTADANASLDTSFDPMANRDVLSIVVQTDGKILIGGQFSTATGVDRRGIARLNVDGSLDTGFDPGVNGDIHAIALQADGKILIGGFFTMVGGVSRNRIARLNANGSLDIDFDSDVNEGVLSVVLQADGKILIGGLFTMIEGVSRNHIARLNASGPLDTGFDPNAINTDVNGTPRGNTAIFSMASQADGKIVIGGRFTIIGGVPRQQIARLNADGSLDIDFDPNANDAFGGNEIFSILPQANGKILIGGRFITIGGIDSRFLALLNADGSLDTNFAPNVGGAVVVIAAQTDGKILIGGSFRVVADVPRNSIARLNADGSLDTNFDPDAAFFGGGTFVVTIALQADGKILIGGPFNMISGITRNRIARLKADDVVDDDDDDQFCVPINARNGNFAVVCL